MLIIGLTGSIATGKSTVAGMLRQMRFLVHDSDQAAHALTAPGGAAVPWILDQFGTHIGSLDKGIDRKILGDLVFADSQKRLELEAILHPLIEHQKRDFIRQGMFQRRRAVFFEVPLLFETGGDGFCDRVITLWSPFFLQQRRALRRDGMSEKKLSQIVATQYPQPIKKRLSDLTLPSSLGRAETYKRLKKWLKSEKLI